MAQVDRPATVWLKTTTEVYRLMRSTGRKVLPHIHKTTKTVDRPKD